MPKVNKKADETLQVAPPAAPATVPAHAPTDIPAQVSGELVTLNVDMGKNKLEIVPNMAMVDEFCADNKDKLPTDILKVTKHHDGSAMDARRHDVWGDARTFVELLEHWIANGWRMVPPDEIGALTTGLILESPEGFIFYHEDAKLQTPAQELVEGRTVKFAGDPANKEMTPQISEPTAVDTATDIDEDTMKTAAKKKDEAVDEMSPLDSAATADALDASAPPPPPPAAAPMPSGNAGGNVSISSWPSELLIDTIKKLTGNENFAADKELQASVEALAEALKNRPVEAPQMEETKMAALKMVATLKTADVVHMPGHRNSKGELAPWVNKRTRDGKIISSHGSKEEAMKHLRDMEYYKHAKQAAAMDAFTKAYVEAAMEESDEDNQGRPLSQNYGIHDIAPQALQHMIEDCAKFQEEAGDLISDETYIEGTGRDAHDQAGYDFWHSRNGSGVGFWEDADWEKEAGTKLQALAHKFGTADMYVGDDGQIWISPMGNSASHLGSYSSGGAITDQDTARVLEGDKSIEGKRENETVKGVTKPETTKPLSFQRRFSATQDGSNPFLVKQADSVMPPIDPDNGKVLEGEKSVADHGSGEENNTGVTPASEASVRMFANAKKGTSVPPPQDANTGKVLEGEKSVADHGSGEENNTGVQMGSEGSVDKAASRKVAAVPSLAAAIKLMESMMESTKEMFIDAKEVLKWDDTRIVNEGVESLYQATRTLAEAVKYLNKKRRSEEEAEALKASQDKKKKSSLLSNLKVAAVEEEPVVNTSKSRSAFRVMVASQGTIKVDRAVRNVLVNGLMSAAAAYKAAAAAQNTELMKVQQRHMASLAKQMGFTAAFNDKTVSLVAKEASFEVPTS
jgi:hypothetical protein